jgi:hypothetical protein
VKKVIPSALKTRAQKRGGKTVKPDKLKMIREDGSESRQFSSERPKKRVAFASSDEEGEDEIEEIEDSDEDDNASVKDGHEMQAVSRKMALQFKASKKRQEKN